MMTEVKNEAVEKAIAEMRPGIVTRAVDAILEPFAPGMVARRLERRQEIGARRAMLSYAAMQPRYSGMTAYGPLMSEDAELPGYDRFSLMIDCRDVFRNFLLVRAGVNGIARRTVASGIHPKFCTSDERWNHEADEQWSAWQERCDTREMYDMNSVARQIIRACYTDGDLGIRFCEGDDLSLQLIEADLIAQDMRVGINQDTINPLGGVVLDLNTGKPLGYYVGKRGLGGILHESTIVPAESFLMLFRPQRVDQVRGIPLIAPVLQTIRDLDRYLAATRMQANISATYGVVIKREASGQFAMMNSVASTGTIQGLGSTNSSGQAYRTMPLKTGLMTFLEPGEDISSFSPQVPGPAFDQFSKFLVRMVAIGLGTTYEMLMQDYSNMSFSSSRTNLLDMNLTMQEWQRFLIQKFFKPVYEVWVAKRMTKGLLPFNPEAFTKVGWRKPAELGVDPARDSQANVTRLTAGLDTFEQLYSEDGHDWEVMLRQKADEAAFIQKLADERKIRPELISSTLLPGIVKPSEKPGLPAPQVDQSK